MEINPGAEFSITGAWKVTGWFPCRWHGRCNQTRYKVSGSSRRVNGESVCFHLQCLVPVEGSQPDTRTWHGTQSDPCDMAPSHILGVDLHLKITLALGCKVACLK